MMSAPHSAPQRAASSAPRVCVIGAGLSGLAVTKELHTAGVEVVCYEMMPIVSGVFGSYTWSNGRLTSSTISTWYSDFPVEDRQRFMTWREFVDYLEAYVDRFGFRERIALNSKVTRARQDDDGRWSVTVEQGDHSNRHPFHPDTSDVTARTFTERFDHVVVCSGLHNAPHIPAVEGLETFTGRVVHSSSYRDAADFAGARVVVVGAGESASDIALQLAQVAASCTVSMRSAPGTLFPKWVEGNTPDIRDDRLTYNLPRVYKDVILRGQRRFYYKQTEDRDLFRWAADSNFGNDRCPFNTNACKSFGIPEAVVRHDAQLRGAIASIDGDMVRFADGAEVQADVLVFCTGFKLTFGFLDEAVASRLQAVNALWKNCAHPELGDAVFLVGFSRPHQINLLTVAELQARAVALVLSGQRTLPSPDAMRATIEADRAYMARYFGERFEANPALVDFWYYNVGLAKFIGCDVSVQEAFQRDPHLGMKLMFSALNGAHFRLVGPGSDWDAAAAAIKATPQFGNWGNAVLRWTALSALTLWSRKASAKRPELRSIHAQARA